MANQDRDKDKGAPTRDVPVELFIREPENRFIRKIYLTVKQAFKNDNHYGRTPIRRYVLDPNWKREDYDSTD